MGQSARGEMKTTCDLESRPGVAEVVIDLRVCPQTTQNTLESAIFSR